MIASFSFVLDVAFKWIYCSCGPYHPLSGPRLVLLHWTRSGMAEFLRRSGSYQRDHQQHTWGTAARFCFTSLYSWTFWTKIYVMILLAGQSWCTDDYRQQNYVECLAIVDSRFDSHSSAQCLTTTISSSRFLFLVGLPSSSPTAAPSSLGLDCNIVSGFTTEVMRRRHFSHT